MSKSYDELVKSWVRPRAADLLNLWLRVEGNSDALV